MKKILVIFTFLFLLSCGQNNFSEKIIETSTSKIEKVENISKSKEVEIQNFEKNSDIKKKISEKPITIVISSYSGPEEWKNEFPSKEKGYIKDMFSANNTKEFYENRNNFPEENAKIYSLNLDDYRYNVNEMYIKEQVILVLEILSLYKNLDKNFDILVWNTDFFKDEEFLLALKKLKVENLTLNWQKIFLN